MLEAFKEAHGQVQSLQKRLLNNNGASAMELEAAEVEVVELE